MISASVRSVLIVGYDEENIYFHDPLFGRWQPPELGECFKMPTEDFMAGWGGFELNENPNFAGVVVGTPVEVK